MVLPLHDWPATPAEAVCLQLNLRSRVRLDWDGRLIDTIAGIAVASAGVRLRAAVAVLQWPALTLDEFVTAEAAENFPYLPGLRAFREGPVILDAWARLQNRPDVVMFSGHGIAHPLGFGIAAHLGLWLECPSIGVAGSRLYGRCDLPGPDRGDYTELWDEQDSSRVLGAVLRTQSGVRPVYVSPGHMIDLTHSLALTLKSCRSYRLPEPLRWARRLAACRSGCR